MSPQRRSMHAPFKDRYLKWLQAKRLHPSFDLKEPDPGPYKLSAWEATVIRNQAYKEFGT
jgi:hypothetical protein